jgi:repressor LexA
MTPLTPKQQEILAFIQSCARDGGYPPTVREIAAHFGFRSPKAATDHLQALEKKGYLSRSAGMARGLTLVKPIHEEGLEPGGIPIVGDVAAGLPILAVENVMGTLSMESAFGSGELFAVRVRGDSMIDYGIYESDFVIVRRSPTVDQNAIAVVYVDNEATVKKIRKTTHGYQLIAGNPRYQPIEITPETPGFSVAGPVVGVVRAMK